MKEEKIQYFNHQNSLYVVLYNFMILMESVFWINLQTCYLKKT
jgi:hypothetical protein